MTDDKLTSKLTVELMSRAKMGGKFKGRAYVHELLW